jgi:hypothetical protein
MKNRCFDKKRSRGRIDGLVTIAMGVGAADAMMKEEQAMTSPWDDPNFSLTGAGA